MRTLAIDLGTRRVGLALSDEGGRFATPLDVLTIATPQQAADEVMKVVRREGVERLVLGLPLNMNDSFGPQATQAIRWGRDLAARAELPLVFIDERLSSFEAEQHLTDRKKGGERMTRQMKKERLDAIAAAGFLQAFLDGRLEGIDVGDA